MISGRERAYNLSENYIDEDEPDDESRGISHDSVRRAGALCLCVYAVAFQ